MSERCIVLPLQSVLRGAMHSTMVRGDTVAMVEECQECKDHKEEADCRECDERRASRASSSAGNSVGCKVCCRPRPVCNRGREQSPTPRRSAEMVGRGRSAPFRSSPPPHFAGRPLEAALHRNRATRRGRIELVIKWRSWRVTRAQRHQPGRRADASPSWRC